MKKRKNLKRIIITLGAVLCAVIGFFIYQINSGTIGYAKSLDLGNKYLLSEDYENAISAFSNAIDMDSKKAEAYIGRGDAYQGIGDYVSAWCDYEMAEELSGDTTIINEKIGPTEISVVSENGDGIGGANVTLEGTFYSYELTTDYSGYVSAVLFPERYDVQITTEDYITVNTELSAEKGRLIDDQIQLVVYPEYEDEEETVGTWFEEETPYESYYSSSGDYLDADFLIGDWCTPEGTYLSFYEDGYYYLHWGFSVEEEGYWYYAPIDEKTLYIEMDGSLLLSLMTTFYGSILSDYHFEILKHSDNGFYLAQVYEDYTAETAHCKMYFERIN